MVLRHPSDACVKDKPYGFTSSLRRVVHHKDTKNTKKHEYFRALAQALRHGVGQSFYAKQRSGRVFKKQRTARDRHGVDKTIPLRFSVTPRLYKNQPSAPGKSIGEQGSAIWFLFLGIALLGALSFALLQGSRNNLAMITDEATKTAAYQSQDCANSVALAQKRLQTRGCGAAMSMEADGSNPHTGAPSDGSCSVYHPAGGGVTACNVMVSLADSCLTGPIGTACESDGAFYVGDMNGHRIYAAANDAGQMSWKTSNTSTVGTNNQNDGRINTNAIIAAGIAFHHAARACTTKPPAGLWYLPARNELALVWTNKDQIVPISRGFTTGWYLSSTQQFAENIYIQRFSNGDKATTYKTYPYSVRCFRRNP